VFGAGCNIPWRCFKYGNLSCVVYVSDTSIFERRNDVQSGIEAHFDDRPQNFPFLHRVTISPEPIEGQTPDSALQGLVIGQFPYRPWVGLVIEESLPGNPVLSRRRAIKRGIVTEQEVVNEVDMLLAVWRGRFNGR
jgi:hypothetical protein